MTTPADETPPVRTLAQTMRQPRWIGMLVLALAVAAVFAWLGQWQLGRAIVQNEIAEGGSETVVPLETVVKPGTPMYESDIGRMVASDGAFVPGDFIVISNRLNGADQGYWVSGHFETARGVALAVGLGWTAERSTADDVAERLNRDGLASLPEASASPQPDDAPAPDLRLTGRVLPSQGPELPPEGDPFELTTMSVAALINVWSGMDDRDVYSVYVVSADAPDGLTRIDAPPPEPDVQVNWLNIFYAIEWVVFAGFAVFFWYRLVKDAWERENELAAEMSAATQSAHPANPSGTEHVD